MVEILRLQSLSGHRDSVYALQPGRVNSTFYSTGGDGMVVEWDLNKPEMGRLFAQIPNSVYAMHFDADKNSLIVGQNFQGIHILDCESKKEIGSLQFTKASIFDIKKYNKLILVGTGEGILYIIHEDELRIVDQVKVSEKSIRTILLNPMRDELLVGASDNRIYTLSLDDFTVKNSWLAHDNSVFTLALNRDCSILLSGARDARVKVWDAGNDYHLKQEVIAHMYAINHVHFSPDYKHFVTCSMDKSIKVWSFDEMKLLKVIDKARYAGHGTSVNKLLWTSFNSQLISASDDRTISIWKLIF